MHHSLLTTDSRPQVGDWAFFGKFHIALVTSVDEQGNFQVIEANPYKLRVALSSSEYMVKKWGPPSFFGRLK